MGKNNKNVTPVDETTTIEPVVETVETEAPASTPKKPNTVKGVVSNCKKLYLRKAADKTSAAVTILDAGTELRINQSESSDEWLKVSTKNKKNGYCMSEFVTINS